MNAPHMLRDFDDSQLSAERRRARVRLCAATPRDTRPAGIGAFDEAADRRIERYITALVVFALPVLAFTLYHSI